MEGVVEKQTVQLKEQSVKITTLTEHVKNEGISQANKLKKLDSVTKS